MASYLYGKGRNLFLGQSGPTSINWITDDIKVVLVDKDASTGYTRAQNTDDFLTGVIPAGCKIATSSNLASKTSVLGTADAADITFSTVSGTASEYLVGYKDTGNVATSPLIWQNDDYTGLPVTPNGGNITVSWPAGGIFTL